VAARAGRLCRPAANFLLAILIFAGFIAAFGAPRTPAVVETVVAGPAAPVAFRKGTASRSINGERSTACRAADYARLRPGEDIVLTVERRATLQARHAPASVQENDRFGNSYRVGPARHRHQRRAVSSRCRAAAHPRSGEDHRSTIENTALGLWQIISGRRPIEELGGPVKMAQVAGQVASLGPWEFVQLLAFFSINLGFINLLPVPMLDGGHLALYAVEAVRRRPLEERAQEWLFRGGLAALMTLFLVATFNDLGVDWSVADIGAVVGLSNA
jgi:regulator of sigma E protease